jgi:hyperosmotically inducible protein
MKQLRQYLSALFLAVTLVSVVGCASTSKQEGTGEYVDDSVITTKVKAAIFNEPTLKSAEINVETFKGAVQLSGFVSSQAINIGPTGARRQWCQVGQNDGANTPRFQQVSGFARPTCFCRLR